MKKLEGKMVFRQICVHLYTLERVGAVIIIQSDMCVYTEYEDGKSGN